MNIVQALALIPLKAPILQAPIRLPLIHLKELTHHKELTHLKEAIHLKELIHPKELILLKVATDLHILLKLTPNQAILNQAILLHPKVLITLLKVPITQLKELILAINPNLF